jgi:hypothetical protein
MDTPAADLFPSLGVAPFDLAGNWCGECGQPKINRLFDVLTGCPECDEVITRHRCTARPDRADLGTGDTWECPDCGAVWQAIEQAGPCGECGQDVREPGWDSTPGPYLDTAPRHEPAPSMFAPFRNLLPRRRPPQRAGQPGACYRLPSGSMVHVMAVCRCGRR